MDRQFYTMPSTTIPKNCWGTWTLYVGEILKRQ
jgi:hypothetical protein